MRLIFLILVFILSMVSPVMAGEISVGSVPAYHLEKIDPVPSEVEPEKAESKVQEGTWTYFMDKWLINGSAWGSATGALLGDIIGAALGGMIMGPPGIVVGKMIGSFTVGMIGSIAGEYADNKIGFGANYADFTKPGYGQGPMPEMGPMEKKFYFLDRYVISLGGLLSNVGHILLHSVLPAPLLFITDVAVGTLGDHVDGMVSMANMGKQFDKELSSKNGYRVEKTKPGLKEPADEEGMFVGSVAADLTDLRIKRKEAYDELLKNPGNRELLKKFQDLSKELEKLEFEAAE